MKWMLLLIVTVVGLNGIRPAEPVLDVQAAKTCGTDPACIRRYNNARRDAIGSQWEEPTRFIMWTPVCPTATWVEFQICYESKSP